MPDEWGIARVSPDEVRRRWIVVRHRSPNVSTFIHRSERELSRLVVRSGNQPREIANHERIAVLQRGIRGEHHPVGVPIVVAVRNYCRGQRQQTALGSRASSGQHRQRQGHFPNTQFHELLLLSTSPIAEKTGRVLLYIQAKRLRGTASEDAGKYLNPRTDPEELVPLDVWLGLEDWKKRNSATSARKACFFLRVRGLYSTLPRSSPFLNVKHPSPWLYGSMIEGMSQELKRSILVSAQHFTDNRHEVSWRPCDGQSETAT